MPGSVTFQAVEHIGEVPLGADIAALLIKALERAGIQPAGGDIFVVAQKIISKAEERFVDLDGVEPSAEAKAIAEKADKDPRLVETILSESKSILRIKTGVIIAEHRLGYVMANAGIDRSNLGPGREGQVLLLPVDPDRSAAELRERLQDHFGVPLGIIISDSFGRAWRNGVVNIALGASGVPALIDARGRCDRDGRPLAVTEIAFADAVAAGAALLMGEGDESTPVVLARGADLSAPHRPASSLLRPSEEDLFR